MVEETLKQFNVTKDGMEEIAKRLTGCFIEGLSQEKHNSSVKMFITYVHALPNGSEVGEYLALDLGGSNFRVLKIIIKDDGTIEQKVAKEKLTKDKITSTQEVLFDHVADCVAEFITEHGIKETLPLGYTFSFPVDQKSLTSGFLVRWTKDFDADGAVGQDVVRLLMDAFKRKKLANVDVVALVNDTTGTQMALGWSNRDCYVGLILGTGTNACYLEETSNIPKYTGDKSKNSHVIINCEWGAFGEKGELDDFRNKIDEELDKGAVNVKEQPYEKMISGKYLGEMVRLVCHDLITKKLLCGGKMLPVFEEREKFESAFLSTIEQGDGSDISNTKSLKDSNEVSVLADATDDDCRIIRRVCEAVSTRAARLAAAGIVALVRKIKKLDKCTVAVDGSLYKLHPHFKDRMIAAMKEMEPNNGIVMKLSEDGSGRGAAMVAAVAHRMK